MNPNQNLVNLVLKATINKIVASPKFEDRERAVTKLYSFLGDLVSNDLVLTEEEIVNEFGLTKNERRRLTHLNKQQELNKFYKDLEKVYG